MNDFGLACRKAIEQGVCFADCCGFVGFEPELVTKHPIQDVEREEIGGLIYFHVLVCPYLKDNKCSIYEDRPQVCKIYGLHSKLPCPHLKSNGRKRGEASKKQVERQQEKLMKKVLGENL